MIFAYIAPETMLPVASTIAAVAGMFMMFGRNVMGMGRRLRSPASGPSVAQMSDGDESRLAGRRMSPDSDRISFRGSRVVDGAIKKVIVIGLDGLEPEHRLAAARGRASFPTWPG